MAAHAGGRRISISECAVLLLAVLPLGVVGSKPAPHLPRVASGKKIGIRRELSTVDLNEDLKAPDSPKENKYGFALPGSAPTDPPIKENKYGFALPGSAGATKGTTVTKAPVFRANSFVGVTPQIDPSDPSALEPPKTSHAPPSRKNSFSIAPPRRETSKADLNDLALPNQPAPQPVERDPEVAAAEQDLKKEVMRKHGIVAGEVSPDAEEKWKSSIIYTGEVLGVGGFSVVHAATDIKSGRPYAVKVVKIPPNNACFVRRLIREVRLLQDLDHVNIVKLHQVFETGESCQLFMERCQGGELLGLMEHMEFSDDGVRSLQWDGYNEGQALEFTEQQIVYILNQVLQAVKFCHDRCIVHRDLKMENLLLRRPWTEGDRHIKLADFGFATVLEESERLTSACGSPHYCSPEVLAGSNAGAPGYRTECDMWAVGVISYSLLCCQYPFDGETDAEVVKAVSAGQFEFPDHVKVSSDAQDFVRSLIVVDTKRRFTIDDALAHPWITKNVAAGTAHAEALYNGHAEQATAAGEGAAVT